MSERKEIIVVGLGPGPANLLTREAWQLLASAETFFLRTEEHPAVQAFPADWSWRTFDALYSRYDRFDDVYDAIVAALVAALAAADRVIYAVPGHPRVGEATTARLEQIAAEQNFRVRVVPGLSFIEPVCDLLRMDPMDGCQVSDAMLLAREYFPTYSPEKPLLLAQLYSRALAGDVKLTLLAAYPPEHEVYLVRHAGLPDASARPLPLYRLDYNDVPFDHLTTLYVPPRPPYADYTALQNIVARLRAPDGCPWDRAQTHLTLREHLLEETYEVLDALDREDMADLQEELGDLLLQVALHVEIATEEEDFRLGDVIHGIVRKLIHRHPHVFGDVTVNGVKDVLHNWEEIKKAEKTESDPTQAGYDPFASVPPTMPALAQAQVYLRKAGADGEAALPTMQGALPNTRSQQAFGDWLLWLVYWAVEQGWDVEAALRAANARFAERVRRKNAS